MKLLLPLAFVVLSMNSLNAQVSEMADATIRLTDPSQIAILQKIEEVYGPDYPPADSQFKQDLIALLNERIFFGDYKLLEKECPLLSSLPLMDATDAEPVPFVPGSFDKDTFNPLRYGFNFFAKGEQWFRLDGTDVVMIVKPYAIK